MPALGTGLIDTLVRWSSLETCKCNENADKILFKCLDEEIGKKENVISPSVEIHHVDSQFIFIFYFTL